MKLGNKILLTIFISMAIGCWASLIVGYLTCNAFGGQYVRGLFWMECIKP